jgi:hypothetical protein
MATKDSTFAVFRTSKLSFFQLADMLAKFDSWEQHNLGAATTSEGRLAWIIHDFAGGKRKGALKD